MATERLMRLLDAKKADAAKVRREIAELAKQIYIHQDFRDPAKALAAADTLYYACRVYELNGKK